ncbi:high mobility group box 3 [Saguinus oedipus]|uniref:High mobility group box 3 n=1 Tax=Saguinus oedipus TaxID=9490 RepID=A0ABQ9UD70_SAGOE|nr:high mobility group box 3 [Saguinus oedipus]
MTKGDPKKPKGKMSAYGFLVQMCRKEHKKKNPEVSVNLAEFSKCSERWKTMSGKEKSKFDEMVKVDKVCYHWEMKDYGPVKEGKKKDPNAPKRLLSGFFLLCSEFHPKIKSTNPGISIGGVAKKLGEMWHKLNDSEKQPYIIKVAKLKEKYEKDVANYKLKGKFDGTKVLLKLTRKMKMKKMRRKRRRKEEEEKEKRRREEEGGGRKRKNKETIWKKKILN